MEINTKVIIKKVPFRLMAQPEKEPMMTKQLKVLRGTARRLRREACRHFMVDLSDETARLSSWHDFIPENCRRVFVKDAETALTKCGIKVKRA